MIKILHFSARQGTSEQQSEAYIGYAERAAQLSDTVWQKKRLQPAKLGLAKGNRGGGF